MSPVPTVHPLDILGRLCMVDNVERLGIERHFRQEIKSVLDYTYRYSSKVPVLIAWNQFDLSYPLNCFYQVYRLGYLLEYWKMTLEPFP